MAAILPVIALLLGLVSASEEQCSLLQVPSNREQSTLPGADIADATSFRLLRKVGSCRASEYTVLWRGKTEEIGYKSAAECWQGCKSKRLKHEVSYATFSNDGPYSGCVCMPACRCMYFRGLASTLVSADHEGALPAECTDCPNIAGKYSYRAGPRRTQGDIEIQQEKCHGTIFGLDLGRFTTALNNKGIGLIAMVTSQNGKIDTVSAHGFIYGERGSHAIYMKDGSIYAQTSVQLSDLWRSRSSEVDGWDFLGQSTCVGKGRLEGVTTWTHSECSSLAACARYATANSASYFSYAACLPPQEDRREPTLEARACGKSGCIHQNKGYREFSQAWYACGNVDGCDVVMKWTNGKYYLRRSSDPIYQRRRFLRDPKLGIPYHCHRGRKLCEIWNTCTKVAKNKFFSVYQQACPSMNKICSGDAECCVGCDCPLCMHSGMPLPSW